MWSHGQSQSWHGAGNLLIALYAEADPAAMFPSCKRALGRSQGISAVRRGVLRFDGCNLSMLNLSVKSFFKFAEIRRQQKAREGRARVSVF